MIRRYRKKPVEIEAILYTGQNINDVWDAFGAGSVYGPVEDEPRAVISTWEGDMKASPGDYIIRGIEGELYPCKPGIFAATYEEIT